MIKKQVETAGTNAGIDRQGERALESGSWEIVVVMVVELFFPYSWGSSC